jgi:minimal PKS acyl carrier protein
MDLLVQKVGLPSGERTDRQDVTLAELGLDSLAFIQLQAELSAEYGVELPDEPGTALTTGAIVTAVNDHLYQGVAR